MTTYKACRQLCGLSQQDASDFHQVPIDTVKSWDNGRRNVPVSILLELASLWRQIEDACDGASSSIELGHIDQKYWRNIEADIVGDELPTEGARKAAGAMALLVTLSELSAE
ncbi:MAG: hypothetical protein H6881_09775 [Rhodobiaceae bacterium]|nr:hypothetical protein [Rhodobiaceae bacterium]